MIFLFGWFIWWIALSASLLLGTTLYYVFRSPGLGLEDIGPSVKLTPSLWWSVAGIIIVLILCGHGGLFYQQWDWQFRNAVFFDLARRPWPVAYDSENPTLLCYYFAFFLPGALSSKLTGLIFPGDIVQFVYTAWGLVIAFLLVCSFLGGRSKWWVLPVMILFSGADTAVSSFLVSWTKVGDWWNDPLLIFDYYKSFSLFEQLALIFNQALPCWIALPLIYAWRHSPGKMLLTCSLLFVFAPLPCVGIALPVTFWCFREWRALVSLPAVSAIVIVILTGLFFISNSNGAAPGFVESISMGKIMILALSFLIFGIGIWLPLVWEIMKRNLTFWLLVSSALVFPFISVGNSSDLGTRAAIPLMIFIFYGVVKFISSAGFRHKPALIAYFFFALGISSYGAIRSLTSSVEGYGIRPGKRFEMIGHLQEPDYNECSDNFIASGESVYSRYLAPPLVVDASEVRVYVADPTMNSDISVKE